ncbi:type II and III secretion system protein [Blastopirellula sp. J2-11]|uniref:type II and III secretion system protein n=1 Tax=Blastopirellula sp. J2-11 TaxID=2943192 RepID=UPI0021C73C0E|nr:type II and III secretion system protein [Blastopirellula sp. J2-11]UUO06690.1 type II and III secretion system protein [Blastopirellula sp. J2-11]
MMMNARFCFGVACFLLLAMTSSLRAGEAEKPIETPEWLSNSDYAIDVFDVNAKRVTITSQKMRETVEAWGYIFMSTEWKTRRDVLFVEPVKEGRIAQLEDTDGHKVLIQLSEFSDLAKKHGFELGVPRVLGSIETVEKEAIGDRVFTVRDVAGNEAHVLLKDFSGILANQDLQLVHPVLGSSKQDPLTPSFNPLPARFQVWWQSTLELQDVVTGKPVTVTDQELRRGLWKKGLIVAKQYPINPAERQQLADAAAQNAPEKSPPSVPYPSDGKLKPAPPVVDDSALKAGQGVRQILPKPTRPSQGNSRFSLALKSTIPVDWIAHPEEKVELTDLDGVRVEVAGKQLRQTAAETGIFFVPVQDQSKFPDAAAKPIGDGEIIWLDVSESKKSAVALGMVKKAAAKLNHMLVRVPLLAHAQRPSLTEITAEQEAENRIFTFHDPTGREVHVPMKQICEYLNRQSMDIVYPVLPLGKNETVANYPLLVPQAGARTYRVSTSYEFRDVVTGAKFSIDDQEFRRGLWKQGALLAKVYPFAVDKPKAILKTPMTNFLDFTEAQRKQAASGSHADSPATTAIRRFEIPGHGNIGVIHSAPTTMVAAQKDGNSDKQIAAKDQTVQQISPRPIDTSKSTAPVQLEPAPQPHPTKPAGTNVQNGSDPFGGPMRKGPLVAPPAAKVRMLRVRVALFEVEPTAPTPKSVLMSADEMLEMVDDEKQYELIDSFDLTTVTGHETKMQQGRRQPVVTGSQMIPQRGPDGRATAMQRNQYNLQNIGSILTVSPEMFGNRASLKLAFERSDLAYPDDDEEVNADDQEETRVANDPPPSTSTMTIDTQVLLEDGQATILSIRNSLGVRHALVIAVEMLDSGEEAEEGGQLRGGGGGGFF